MQPLRDILEKQIISQGAITFENFMETALYCPGLGYYERDTASIGRIGRSGDFHTSVSVGSLFGELLAHRFAAWLHEAGRAGQNNAGHQMLVEAGAHDGQLAADVLGGLQCHHADLLKCTTYLIVEPSPRRREWQRARLAKFAGHIRWVERWDQLAAGVTGVIFSNELLDALPVRRLGWDAAAEKWFEWGVTLANGSLVWVRLPLRVEGAAGFPFNEAGLAGEGSVLVALRRVLPDGFTLELNPRAATWWREAAQALHRGVLVAFDYGLPAEELLRPERAGGTLRAYHDHRASEDLLAAPGEQDLTAHVNFTVLQRVGEEAGLRTLLFDSQERFLAGVLRDFFPGPPVSNNWTPERTLQLQTLTHPQHFGRAFRVLAQEKV